MGLIPQKLRIREWGNFAETESRHRIGWFGATDAILLT